MKTKSENFFTVEEKKKIEDTIRGVEKETSGEIVVMVVERSDEYREVDLFAALFVSACLSVYPAQLVYSVSESLIRKILPVMSWVSNVPDGSRFTSGLVSFIILTGILTVPFMRLFAGTGFLKRIFIPLKKREMRVNSRALAAFNEHRLGETRDATGVLFMISILEKRLRILADHGIYKKLSQGELDKYASSVGRGIASGSGADALCAAIESVGRELAVHFPRKDDDTNELSDRVITRRS